MATQRFSPPKLKKIFQYLLFLFLYVLLFLGTLFLVRYLTAEEPNRNELPPEAFYPADYSANIMDNQAYLSLDRSIYYMNYGTGEPLTEENYQTVGIASSFFYHYFDSIIKGDVAAYRAMLTDNYIEALEPPEKFTMQMLYDIEVNQSHSASTATYQGKTVKVHHFAVSYKIFENNGTFRRDIASNQSVTQYYDLFFFDDKILLNSISDSVVMDADKADAIQQKHAMIDLSVLAAFILAPIIWMITRRMLRRRKPSSSSKVDEKSDQKS